MMKAALVSVLLAGCASATSDAPAAQPAHEVVSGGARLKGGKFRMDVQVGQGLAPRFAKGSNNARLQNAVVVP
jgi:hypothetical protein